MSLFTASLLAAVLGSVPLFAGEHPEHPTKKSPPKKESKWVEDKAVMEDFALAVEDYVEERTEEVGAFEVLDDQTGKTWELLLVNVHKHRIARLAEDKFFACADFKTAEGGKTKVDLDFFVTRTDDGWEVDEVLVHKVNGRPRYVYNDRNERVPVGQAKPAQGGKGKPQLKPMDAPKGGGSREHPAGHEHPAGQEHPG